MSVWCMMCMRMLGSIDSRLLLQLLYLQPVVTLGLLIAIAAIDTTGTQQRAGAEQSLRDKAIAGASSLPKMNGRTFVHKRWRWWWNR